MVELTRSRALPALLVLDSVAAAARRDGDSIPKRQAALSSLASVLKARSGN